MAAETGISKSSVQRYLQLFGLQPHRSETFKLSTDPFFVEKLRDVVGLYLSPPDKALVLCVDEKSQSRRWSARNRCCRWGWAMSKASRTITTAMAPPRCSPRSNVLTATVITQCKPRHRHQEFLSFLREIDKAGANNALIFKPSYVPPERGLQPAGRLQSLPRKKRRSESQPAKTKSRIAALSVGLTPS